MPNHYTTMLTITGDKESLEAFLKAHIVRNPESKEVHFDFNTVIPMPEMLKGTTSGSNVDQGLIALGYEVKNRRGFLHISTAVQAQRMLEYPWVKELGITDVEGLKKWITEERPDDVAEAKKHIAVYEATGYLNWYDWSVTNWGTKWNSYYYKLHLQQPRKLIIRFDTAWSPPMPVIEKLAEMYPQLTFSAKGRDECEDNWSDLR